MTDPTPEAVAAALARLARHEQWLLTVDRPDMLLNDELKALALAQQWGREWVSREDRERALVVERCSPHTMAHREARRLLKLEDTPDA